MYVKASIYSWVVSVDEELLQALFVISSKGGIMFNNIVSLLQSLDSSCDGFQADCSSVIGFNEFLEGAESVASLGEDRTWFEDSSQHFFSLVAFFLFRLIFLINIFFLFLRIYSPTPYPISSIQFSVELVSFQFSLSMCVCMYVWWFIICSWIWLTNLWKMKKILSNKNETKSRSFLIAVVFWSLSSTSGYSLQA